MPFPPLKKKPNFSLGGDPNKDDIGKPPHAEPDFGDEELDGIMSQDITAPAPGGSEDVLGGGDPLESALTDAGFKVTPEQLTQIQAILKPVAAPKAPMMGAGKPPMGGAVPGAMGASDISGL